jgi:oxalate---CoA ligase
METHGRERRWRYFTLASYRTVIANEKLDDQDGPYSSFDFSCVGGFAPVVVDDFYSDLTEVNHFMDYAFSKSGKTEDGGEEAARKHTKAASGASKLAGRGKKRGRQEAGLDTNADGRASPPKKRGRPRKYPLESQHSGTDAILKSVAPLPEGGHGQEVPGNRIEAPPSGGTIIQLGELSNVSKKRRRPPDDGQSGVSAPEGSARARRRGKPRKRLPSLSDAVERPPSRECPNPPDVHMTSHPVSDPPRLPSNTDSREMEVQSSPRELDIAASQGPSHREYSAQPELTFSCLLDDQGPGMTMVTADSHHPDLSQLEVQHSYLSQKDVQVLDEPEPEDGITVRMGSPFANTVSGMETPVRESARTRTASESPSISQKRREKAATPYSRSNVSLLRRENEFFKILEESGGIVHLGSKEFLDAHLALLDSLASAGEPTSGLPGIKVDKRTIENTFESLENRGKVKILKTALSTVTGAQRPARIIYSPTVEQSRLDSFLAELGKGPHGTYYSVRNPTATGVPPGELKSRRPAQPLRLLQSERGVDSIGQWSKNSGRADQLFESDDQTIHDVLLTEKTTLAQLYGFVPGKMMRARELHLATLDALHLHDNSPIPVSPAQRVVNFSQYFQGLPIGVYCSVLSILVQSDELSQILSTEEGRRTLVKDLPQSLRTLLQIGRARSRERLLELFEILHQLNLVAPLQPPDSSTRCDSIDGPSSFDAFTGDVSTTNYRSAPDYWLFHDNAALYLWALSAESPPFWKTTSVHARLDAVTYWNELQPACESKSFSQSVTRGTPSQNIAPNTAFARSITRDASWSRAYDLSWHQRQYLKRFISRPRGDTQLHDEEDVPTLERVSWITSAPLSVVKDFLQKERASQLRELDKARMHASGNEEPENAQRMAQEKELLAKKVADSKARKEREWEAILNAVHPGALEGVAATKVARIRKRYLQSGVASDRSRWEDEVRDAIRQLQGATKAVLSSAQRPAPAQLSRGLASVAVVVPPPETPAAPTHPAGLPPVVANQPSKSIEQLIAEQGPAREDVRKKKRKKKDGTEFLLLSIKEGTLNLLLCVSQGINKVETWTMKATSRTEGVVSYGTRTMMN